jgi:hypothetical protein
MYAHSAFGGCSISHMQIKIPGTRLYGAAFLFCPDGCPTAAISVRVKKSA